MWLILAGLFGMSLHMLYALAPIAIAIYLIGRRHEFQDSWRKALIAVGTPIGLTLPLVVRAGLDRLRAGWRGRGGAPRIPGGE